MRWRREEKNSTAEKGTVLSQINNYGDTRTVTGRPPDSRESYAAHGGLQTACKASSTSAVIDRLYKLNG